ncbi:response regulator [Lachnospiraceae bacterium ZAX-1]
MKREMIVLVDDNIANLRAGKNALAQNYDVFTVPSAEKMFELLKHYMPQLILLDIDMPIMDGYEALKILKEIPQTMDIPVIFLTGKSDSKSELEGLRCGAVGYITKPFLPELLNKHVELHLTIERQRRLLEKQGEELRNFNESLQEMVEQKTQSVINLQTAILQTVADLIERRDGETGDHVVRTQFYLKLMLDAFMDMEGYHEQIEENWDTDLMMLSSQLHDVGKISIKDSILQKPGKLTPEEFDEMKKHTIYGVEIIDRMIAISVENKFLRYARVFAETHQEKWDGSGYPHGLKGKEIPFPGRLMAIADVYDALVSERPYKRPYSHEQAVDIIADGKGTHFDPLLVDVFLEVADEFKRINEAEIVDVEGQKLIDKSFQRA